MNIQNAIKTLKSDNTLKRIDGIDDDNSVFVAYRVVNIIRVDIK